MSEGESYPPNWVHITIHLNPDTGEIHMDSDTLRKLAPERLQGDTRKVTSSDAVS